MQTIPVIQASAEVPSIWDRTQRILDNFGLPRWVRRQQKQAVPTLTPKEASDKFLKLLDKNEAKATLAELHRGDITVNQARAMVGLGPISPGGDSIYQGVPLKVSPTISAANYTKAVVNAAETLKNTQARENVATLSKPIAGSVKSQILEVVKYKSIPVSAREIAAEMPDVPYSTVTTRISEMARSGQLHYTGKLIQYGKVVNGYEIGGSDGCIRIRFSGCCHDCLSSFSHRRVGLS